MCLRLFYNLHLLFQIVDAKINRTNKLKASGNKLISSSNQTSNNFYLKLKF